MKHPIPLILIALLPLHSGLHAQQPDIAIATEPLSRTLFPMATKFSFSAGIGVEYTLSPEIAVELNTMLVAHSLKARYFLLDGNVSPFVSAGFGLASEQFVAAGVSGYWVETQVGVERALDRGFMRIQLHYTIDQTENLGWPQFTPDFTLGYRF